MSRLKIAGLSIAGSFVFGSVAGVFQGLFKSSEVAAKSNRNEEVETSAKLDPSMDRPKEVPAPVAIHSRNYSVEDDGEYGYQQGISNSDREGGVATKALVMVRYKGEVDGKHVVEIHESGAIYRMECKAPCEYIKTKSIAAGEVLRSETIPNVPGSVIRAVFEDVMNGELVPFQRKSNKG